MPNHITNFMKIEGEIDITSLYGTLHPAGKIPEYMQVPDFNKIIPMPEVIKNTGSGTNIIDGESVDCWFQDNSLDDYNEIHKSARKLTPEEIVELKNIGFSNWYDWTRKRWGTKWNSYQCKVHNNNLIEFQTAWASPTEIFETLSKTHPKIKFTVIWKDEGSDEIHEDVYYNGASTSRIVGREPEHLYDENDERIDEDKDWEFEEYALSYIKSRHDQ